MRNMGRLLQLSLGWSGLELHQSLGGVTNLRIVRSSCNSSYVSKDETESDLKAKYDLTLDDLIKAKKF